MEGSPRRRTLIFMQFTRLLMHSKKFRLAAATTIMATKAPALFLMHHRYASTAEYYLSLYDT